MKEKYAVLRDLKQSHRKYDRIGAYVSGPCVFADRIRGRECAYRIEATEKPLVVRDDNGAEKVLFDAGYYWYHFAPEGQYFWLSAAFDPARRLLEVYFDLTAGSDFSDPENPCFRDMYLDIVLTEDGKLRVLDRDELLAARDTGVISDEACKKTLRQGEALYVYLIENTEEVLSFVRKRAEALLKET